MRFFENANYNFIGTRTIGYLVSASMLIISLSAILYRGLQYGIDFRGGTELVISFRDPVSASDLRVLLTPLLSAEPQVRQFGSARELQIRTVDTDIDRLSEQIQQAFAEKYPENTFRIIKTDVIGPIFAQDLQRAASLSTIFSVLVISLYIFVRFKNLPFAAAVLAALVHDVIIIIGIFTLLNGILPFNMDIDQTLIGAFLTIIGYSLNDTIVVFDRIRENQNLRRLDSWQEVVNKSINQTLSRTIVTSLTTFIVVAILFLFGGAVLKGFSFALLIGIILGTYSTIFLACPLLVDMPGKMREKSFIQPKKRPANDRPESRQLSFRI